MSEVVLNQEDGESQAADGNGTAKPERRARSGLDLPPVEPWPEAVEGKELLNQLTDVLVKFVVLPKWAAETLALWVVHTYAFLQGDVCTYIGIESPVRRCGKSKLVALLS
jgi:hypothetical protein